MQQPNCLRTIGMNVDPSAIADDGPRDSRVAGPIDAGSANSLGAANTGSSEWRSC
jgi:hypothetical protein